MNLIKTLKSELTWNWTPEKEVLSAIESEPVGTILKVLRLMPEDLNGLFKTRDRALMNLIVGVYMMGANKPGPWGSTSELAKEELSESINKKHSTFKEGK